MNPGKYEEMQIGDIGIVTVKGSLLVNSIKLMKKIRTKMIVYL